MTTGTNIRRLDTIALLRPTASPGLFVQMVGRGFRLSPETGKTECLVLDYGRNVERFGPIDAIRATGPKTGGGNGPLAKVCSGCRALVPLSVMLCRECGFQFPMSGEERRPHEGKAANAGILSGEVTLETYDVGSVTYQVWTKRGAAERDPKTVRVTYRCVAEGRGNPASLYDSGAVSFSEWVCPEHTGYARSKFEKWWRQRGYEEFQVPRTAEDVCEADFMGLLRTVERITVRHVAGKNYPEIVGCEVGGFPERSPVNADEESDGGECDDLPF